MEAKQSLGAIASLFVGIVAGFPLGLTTFYGSWSGIYDYLLGNLTMVAYLVAFIAIGAVAFGLKRGMFSFSQLGATLALTQEDMELL